MGLDLSVYRIKKCGEVSFSKMYYQIDDETLKEAIMEYDEIIKKEIEYYEREEGDDKEYFALMKGQVEKRYEKIKNIVRKYNKGYNELTIEEKEKIKKIEAEEVKYYGKNWDMFHLLNHELCGGLFDHDTQDPTGSLSKEDLQKVYEIESLSEEENSSLELLKELIETADFENYYYYIEAWY